MKMWRAPAAASVILHASPRRNTNCNRAPQKTTKKQRACVLIRIALLLLSLTLLTVATVRTVLLRVGGMAAAIKSGSARSPSACVL